MPEILYVLSKEFDYSKMICSDAGPEYAKDLGWKTALINNVQLVSNCIYIIDNRLTEKDLILLSNLIVNSSCTFLFTITDPYNEDFANTSYFKFLFEICKKDNIYFLSKYVPTEKTLDLQNLIYPKKILFLPYPYLESKEISLFKKKKNKIIFSGNINKIIYPYRYNFWMKNKRNIGRLIIDFLKHPGYSDLNIKRSHETIGSKYIVFLAQYKYMFLCPSRNNLEFLKYRECAYAGCYPIGIKPDSIKGDLIDYVSERLTVLEILKLVFMPDFRYRSKVNAYRNFFRQYRNPKVLNEKLQQFLLEI